MFIDWIGRVFGGQESDHRAGALIEQSTRANGASALSSVVGSLDTLASELDRARRYEHALSIVVMSTMPLIHPNGSGNGTNVTNGTNGTSPRDATLETNVPQVVSLLAARVLRDVVRGSDVICYRPAEDHLVLALTESDVRGARKAVRRIGDLFRSRLRLDVRAGLARFPDDGLTVEDLVSTAVARAAVGLAPSPTNDHP